MLSYCLSCCAGCFISPPSSLTSNSPYALHNLLQVGTILVNVQVDVQHFICDHNHAEDGWHDFKAGAIIPHLTNTKDINFCRELEFLAKQRFISATYCSSHVGLMILRIYLIPYDLRNVQGKLRVRKETVLNPAKRYLRNLLPKIKQSIDRWKGLESAEEGRSFLPENQDSRTLAEIYSDLCSPRVSPVEDLGGIAMRLLNFEDDLEGLGMRSTLYRYQRRSVAAMLQNELDLQDVPDPLYIPVRSVDDKPFYLQPGTMEILQELPMTAPCKGGILCEELGTGKTVMILGLIVATKNQISSPEPSIVDERPVMTPLAFRHFPSSEFASARKRFYNGYDPNQQHSPGSRVPTLVELMIHQYRVVPSCDIPNDSSKTRYLHNVRMEDEVQTLPLGDVMRANAPFYHHYLGEPSNRERTQRKQRELGPRVMYLTSATLVIVPANLLSQWDREITKHCDVPLRVLILRARTPMPNAQSLATDYDIILMTYTRFTAEAAMHDISKTQSWTPCTCPEFLGYRVPNCTCQNSSASHFLQIRWKRLVIDEGHVSATLSTTLVPFAKLLSVERRWIVTGTPTTNLLGLRLGSNKTTEVADTKEEADLFTDADESQASSSSSSTPHSSPPPTFAPRLQKRIWNKYDREDLNKLGNMITHFVAVPQFHSDSKLISTHVTGPLLDASGPRCGSMQVLNQVMEMVMIRHRIEDVEKDVILPPVTQESVLLDLDPLVVKSFNALQAIIAINAIDSQRTDQDYLFHPRNTEFLQETVKNMSQILFWHVDEDLYNAAALLRDTETQIRTAIERNMPEDDITTLKEAFRHLELALNDPLWRSIQKHEDVPYRISNMVESVYVTWTRTPGREPSSPPNQTGFLHADRLLKLYDMILQKPLIRENAMVEWGQAVATRDQMLRRAYEESLRKKGKGRKKTKHSDDHLSSSTSLMADNFAKKASAADTLKEMQKELDTTMARLAREEDEGEPTAVVAVAVPLPPAAVAQPRRLSKLASGSPLAGMRVGSSASTKLNYIINEVQKYSATEKFLIFSESPLSLAHVAEALELINVKFLRFTTQVTPQFREQLVLTFETSETYRVFLMELKHGARGLNLISASRVIFCEPVWQADVESQAIKRAHRIGQTKLITVKTLAIRETAEENMVARRSALRNSQEKLPKLIEEAGMRHYIANPRFITQPPTITPSIDFPFINLPAAPGGHTGVMLKIPPMPRSQGSPSLKLKRLRLEDPANELSSEHEESPTKKKKGFSIRFA